MSKFKGSVVVSVPVAVQAAQDGIACILAVRDGARRAAVDKALTERVGHFWNRRYRTQTEAEQHVESVVQWSATGRYLPVYKIEYEAAYKFLRTIIVACTLIPPAGTLTLPVADAAALASWLDKEHATELIKKHGYTVPG